MHFNLTTSYAIRITCVRVGCRFAVCTLVACVTTQMKLKCCIWSTSHRRCRMPPPQTLHYTEIVLIYVHMFQFILINNHHIFNSNTLVSAPRKKATDSPVRARVNRERKTIFVQAEKKSSSINKRRSISIHFASQLIVETTTEKKHCERKIRTHISCKTTAENERNGSGSRSSEKKSYTFCAYVIIIFCAIKRFANTHTHCRVAAFSRGIVRENAYMTR